MGALRTTKSSLPVLNYPLSLTHSQNDPKKGVAGEREHVAVFCIQVKLVNLQDFLNTFADAISVNIFVALFDV